MRISIFGLGYVGTVSAGCLASENHQVIGVDTNSKKVDVINEGRSPIIEKGIGELIAANIENGRLSATTDGYQAVMDTDISFVCVGTPNQPNGNLDLQYVRRVCQNIGTALKEKTDHHLIVIRSTVLPGSMRKFVIPTLENSSGKSAAVDFGICYNPEFLREGSAVQDFFNPSKTVIGEGELKSGDRLAGLYQTIEAPLFRTDFETAETLKYVDNAWHALKIGFANEVGNICKALRIDSHQVMQMFCADTKLNISPNYLKPGFAFGGSCLPKDLRALIYKGRELDLNLPILNSILPSNVLQVEKGIQLIQEKGNKKVGFLGFSFKAGTDDLRESPVVEVIERLLGKGYDIRIYDQSVNLTKLIGANREFVLDHIPHISRLMVSSVEDVMRHAESIVIGTNDPEFAEVLNKITEKQVIIDFVRIADSPGIEDRYDGICW